VATVGSCIEAHAWLNDNRPALALVDIMLRDGPSDSVAARLTAMEIPFLVSSGDDPRAMQIRRSLGVNGLASRRSGPSFSAPPRPLLPVPIMFPTETKLGPSGLPPP